jgi:hypothetical protein
VPDEGGPASPHRRGRASRLTRRRIAALVVVVLVAGVAVAAVRARTMHHPDSAAVPPAPSHRSPSSSIFAPSQAPTASPEPVSSPPAFVAWPTAATTGVPASALPLQTMGQLVVTKNGATYTGLEINGCVDVMASDVTISQSVIHCNRAAPAVHVFPEFGNLVLDQVEIDGSGVTAACVGYDDFTILRSNLHDCEDGVDFGSNVTVQESYIHDLARQKGTHNDVLQTLGGSGDLIEDNTLEAYKTSTNDLMNSAIQTGHLDKDLVNVLVEHNYMDGGNYTVNAGSTSRSGHQISGYVFKDNVFGRHSRYGPVQALGTGIVFDTTNVWADTNESVRPGK